MKFLIFTLIYIGECLQLSAETLWRASEHGAETSISYGHDPSLKIKHSLNGLEPLLQNVNVSKPIKHICFWHYLSQDSVIQRELMNIYEENYPEILKAAINSSGNLHNPKLDTLRKHFSDSIRKTATLRSIDKLLLKYGYTISGISQEKFRLNKTKTKVKFESVIWIEISKKQAKAPIRKNVKNSQQFKK